MSRLAVRIQGKSETDRDSREEEADVLEGKKKFRKFIYIIIHSRILNK